ncbi:MAG TPA: hypothetical protein PKY70_12460 [Nakamurella multipartita]|nr:hypothetical protein [Nakamurella multipartita]
MLLALVLLQTLAVLAAPHAPDLVVLLLVAVLVTLVLAAFIVVPRVAAVPRSGPPAGWGRTPRSPRPIIRSLDPDAAGRARPRAPGRPA